ncbi:proton-coupled amino acid transporter-like protein pathetic [Anthonomus grandis grandis]|uniref:proton-coupled amino acid transporter-like protein pathetic n=1 Tax=Anthonomus grandis grandis TaxID=2921223 RepID=UPI0021669B26|nr:proton-coupled amino acid transporter-like protein pathetic [Anthonomus grandis grandis]XP_050315652.1 proton-coupled amino acid transporter-like protein pathetic [Anthonomus grandis grandis]XP_050315660.1 proton-coupled amino acid transporter-like protein pathetic [Anthonomus grandis grandis]XP_050315668.1 proton-coupled amino acid transporter-like protein pathetic [Anthonomus grandis grandis]
MSEKEKIATINGTATEMETFLPKDNSATNGVTKYKIKGEDFEAAIHEFDPFKARDLEHPVSNLDTLTHLLKASLGTGILSMPMAFASSGLVMGIFSTIMVSVICTHCSYILVVCAHELYRRSGKTQMSFAEVAEEACKNGPKWARPFAEPARHTVLIGLFVTYFFTCSCYSVIMANSINYVLEPYMEVNIRLTIAALLIPLILLAYVPNLKYLAPCSMIANVCMGIGLAITFYYLVTDIPPITDRRMVGEVTTLPISVAITIFAIEAIGVIMPLENHMSTPQKFTGICGVLNQGMSFVTLAYILLGFFGYLRYGDQTADSITSNLPKDAIASKAVNILVAIAVFFTFGLQFYVCLDIAWNGIKEKCTKHPTLSQYGLRTIMVIVCVGLAIAVPTIVPFVGLIGAFCFSILGLMVPVAIEIITFWGKGFGPGNWKIFKNIIIVATGILALIFGSKSSIEAIIKLYVPAEQ